MRFLNSLLIASLIPFAANAAKPGTGTLEESIASLEQTMQLIGVDLQTLSSSTQTLNTSNIALNSSTTNLNQTNTTLNTSVLSLSQNTQILSQSNAALNTSVQSLDAKLTSLEGSVTALKASIDSLAASGGSSGGGGSGENNGSGLLTAENTVFITNCSVTAEPVVAASYRCVPAVSGPALLNLFGQHATFPTYDVIYTVPADKTFVMTDFQTTLASPLNNGHGLQLVEKDTSNVSTIRRYVIGVPTGLLNFTRAQGGMKFAPGSQVILRLPADLSSEHYAIVFEMSGYLTK